MKADRYLKSPGQPMRRVLMFLALIFMAIILPPTAGATDPPIPSFGEGKVKVRLYSDYFCPPCRDMEPGIEPVITDLVRSNAITLIFVDTPFYRYSSLYARCFLYAINAKKDLEHALRVRRALIEAAKNGLDSADKLETFLKKDGIALKPFDPGHTFKVFSRHLKEDAIDATPSCVIETNGETKKHGGPGNIIDALKRWKTTQPET